MQAGSRQTCWCIFTLWNTKSASTLVGDSKESAGELWTFLVEAYIWTQSNSDLEEYARKDVRQDELLSAFSACGSFFGAWEITHGKPPTAPSNPPSECFEDACSGQFFVGQREIRGMHASMGTASSCLGFQSGVRDFRRDAGTWSMEYQFNDYWIILIDVL